MSAQCAEAIAAATPLIQDAVITGHDRDEIGVLVFPNPAACRGPRARSAARAAWRRRCARLAQDAGQLDPPGAPAAMSEPPSIDANEITDKGYINQRAVLERRAALVEKLYSDAPEVIKN